MEAKQWLELEVKPRVGTAKALLLNWNVFCYIAILSLFHGGDYVLIDCIEIAYLMRLERAWKTM